MVLFFLDSGDSKNSHKNNQKLLKSKSSKAKSSDDEKRRPNVKSERHGDKNNCKQHRP
jgi:hypothetical protein